MYFSKIQVPSVPGGNREAKSIENAIILAGPCAQGVRNFFKRNIFANLAARVCQIVRNGKGREKQSALRCVRSCEMVKGEKKNARKEKTKQMRSILPCGKGYVDGQPGTLRAE